MIKLARFELMYLASMLVLSGCIVAPRIPIDPHRKAIDLLQSDEATRESLINIIGPPDFVLGDLSAVWIASKTSADLVDLTRMTGEGVGERDFFLTVDFDAAGKVISHEVYVDSGSHDHCMGNGICFSANTRSIPLAPEERELGTKKFDSVNGGCAVYIYRGSDGTHAASDDYVYLSLTPSFANYTDDKKQFLSLSAISVPGG